MSFDKMIREYRHLFVNPRPMVRPFPPPQQVFSRIFMAIRKRLLVIFIMSVMTMIVIGLLVPEGTFSIYTDYGITSTTKQPTGVLWTVLWWIRGQPAGWQAPTATGLFAVRKTIGGEGVIGHGFNGPLNPLALLFEFLVDFMIYVPHFLDPGFVAVNLDLIPGFIIKMIVDVGAMGLFVMIVIPALGVSVFFLPLIIQRLWVVSGPLFRLIILAIFFLFVYMLFMGYLNPLIEAFLGRG